MLVPLGINGSKAASSASLKHDTAKNCAPPGGSADAPAGAAGAAGAAGMIGPASELLGSYILDFLLPENAGNKTIPIRGPKGKISGKWASVQQNLRPGLQHLTRQGIP